MALTKTDWFERRQFPARCERVGDGLRVAFSEIAPDGFIDSFTDWTVQRLSTQTESFFLDRSEISALANQHGSPAGMIFHISRCGSTLVSQLLKEIPNVTVYSEPMIINDILMPPATVSRKMLVRDLRAVGTLLSRHAGAPFIIKFRSWNTYLADLIVEAYSDTPWIFCTRDPVEVAVSVMAKPPTWLRALEAPSNPFFQWVPATTTNNPEQYVAQTIAAFHKSITAIAGTRGNVIDYDSLPSAIWLSIADQFGFKLSAVVQERMKIAASLYSKSPVGQPILFQSDRYAKQASASKTVRLEVERDETIVSHSS